MAQESKKVIVSKAVLFPPKCQNNVNFEGKFEISLMLLLKD